MRNSIDISVIIPVYNVGRYVAKTIESVLDQDFDSYEVILVDDGSKDESGVICDRYAKDNDKISVIHKENGGVMSARFAGLDVARGDYIAFLDGDDRVPPTALSSFYKAMKENPVDYVNGCYINIDDEVYAKIIKDNDISVPRLRGYRWMGNELAIDINEDIIPSLKRHVFDDALRSCPPFALNPFCFAYSKRTNKRKKKYGIYLRFCRL